MKNIFDNLPTKQRRQLQTLLGIASIFAILGVANTLYGNRKYQQCARHYREASSAIALPDPLSKQPFAGALSSPDYSAQLEKLKASVKFYEFVTLGGKYFLAAGGLLFLLSLFFLRQPNHEIQD